MESKLEGLEPHNTPGAPVPNSGSVQLTPEEFAELKRRADASSQNFERLKKEELRAAELEAKLALQSVSVDPDDESVHRLESKVSTIESQLLKQELLVQYPILKDTWNDFESFRSDPENSGMSMKVAAKAFLIEKGLIGSSQRKGLETVTGGDRVPQNTGYTAEEIRRIRETDPKRYRELVRKDQIGPIQ